MEKTIAEHVVRLSGSVNVEQELELGMDVSLLVTGGVVKIEEHDNHDRTVKKVYVVKPVTAESTRGDVR